MTKSLIQSMAASNREAWNASAAHHQRTDAWRTLLASVSRADFSCLDDTITKLLLKIGVDGKSVIQLGCNNGRECLSMVFRCAAATLRNGGTLVIYETHPFLEMFLPESADPFRLTAYSAPGAPFPQTPTSMPSCTRSPK